jgi:phosphatidylglycerol:prolipoprotein diacylglycerol transferase
MYPYITVFGRQIPMYGIMAILGIAFGVGYILLLYKKSGLSRDDSLFSYMYGVFGAFIGAKLLSIVTVLPNIIDNIDMLWQDPALFLSSYVLSGFVFYGGLYGAIAGVYIYVRRYKLDFWQIAGLLVPTVPLVHAFGRVGCFFEGCCYGMPSEQVGIVLKNSLIAPNNIPLFPVQLVESGGDLLIFALTALLSRKGCRPRLLTASYLMSYGVLRFVLEFFRYDSYRGFIGPISLSQAISIITMAFAIYLIIADRKKHPAQ